MTVKRRLRRVLVHARKAAVALNPPALPDGTLDCVFARNEHGMFCIPRGSSYRPAAQAVLQGRTYEEATIRLLCGVEGSVVHAGTFFGDFLPALSRSRAGDVVWAFEPNRESYRCAEVTVLLNGLENVTLTNAALGAMAGEGILATSDAAGRPVGGGSRLIDAPDARAHEAVAILSIDRSVVGPIAAIHLDVEGHERQALEGAIETITEHRPLLVLETLPDDWVAEHLEPLGYRPRAMAGRNTVLGVSQA